MATKRNSTSIEALREYFSVPAKPVTNAELITFRREDRDGFDELAELAKLALDSADVVD